MSGPPPPGAPPSADLAEFLRSLSWWWRSDDPAAQLYAAQRFQSYACDAASAHAVAGAAGALRFLVHALQADYAPGREAAKAAAAQALANLVSTESVCVCVWSAGVFSTSITTQFNPCFSTQAFHDAETRRAVGAAGAVPAAVGLLTCHSDAVAEAAAGLLANLAADGALLVDAAGRGAPAALVALLRTSQPAAREEALAFLFQDASRSPDRAAFLASLGMLHLAVRSLALPLSPRGTWLVGLLWSAALPAPDRVVQHELAKLTPLLVHMGTSAPSPACDAALLLLADYAAADETNASHARRAGAEPLFAKVHASRDPGHPAWGAALAGLCALGVDPLGGGAGGVRQQ